MKEFEPKTPRADALRDLGKELNASAMNQLAGMEYDELVGGSPELFDPNGDPWYKGPVIIPTQHEPYFRESN